jgi:glucans biosynthesis protein
MDSPSCAGVYSFTIRPGEDVVFDVAASIFPRTAMTKTGVAAMSSMFLFNVADPSPLQDYRTAVHDSDGLAIWTGQGEHIWRPLQNPKAHRLSNFPDENPKGFGLVSGPGRWRTSATCRRATTCGPACGSSLWTPGARARCTWPNWPPPRRPTTTSPSSGGPRPLGRPGSQVDLRYRLHWGQERFASPDARVFRTRTGADAQAGLRLFTVDLQGGALAEGLDGVAMDLQAQGGEIVWRDLSPYPDEAAARVAFGVRPKAANMDLSLRLARGDQTISETWRYLWTA